MMMLSPQIIKSITSYSEKMNRPVTLVLQKGEHEKQAQLEQFLVQISQASELIQFELRSNTHLRSPISFFLEVDQEPTGIEFSGIPSGHEFNSLILAILQAGGYELKLDQSIQERIRRIQTPLHFEVFISLNCHNCPEVVQILNQFALLNPLIRSEMIDGGLFQSTIQERNIQGVPAVYLNGKAFLSGQVNAAQILEQLQDLFPDMLAASTQVEYKLQDVVVLGGGPAGASAAIYAARKGLEVTLIAERIGGQVKDTMTIENLISIPKTTGTELAGALQNHISAYPITVLEHVRVVEIEQGHLKVLTLSSGELIRCKTLIIATGAKWRELGVPGEQEYKGKGVAYCPHCDGPFFKDKPVAVIGGGNSGLEAALDLAHIAQSVIVLEYGDQLKADHVLIEQAKQKPNIQYLTSVQTQEILAQEGQVHALRYLDRNTNEVNIAEFAGVFVQIGLIPNSRFVQGCVDLTAQGEVIINDRCETSAQGIYACGDVTTVPYKQIIIAMGEGAKAGLAAFEYILAQQNSFES
tara:strand:- start:727 stop:2301 length:1575 start_codon:yes stop_codon:yes gene_type:complete